MTKLDHLDKRGKINMIDVTQKPVVIKKAQASGFIHLKPETISLIKDNKLQKGEVITVAEVSGIQAANHASSLIPLALHVSLTHVDVKAYVYPNGIEVKSSVKSVCQSGIEIEALTAVSVALLTIFEICKHADSSMTISDIKLLSKVQEEGLGV
jgi:cyclic pyranopterin phosphate synthase